jgi:hypothetical protein
MACEPVMGGCNCDDRIGFSRGAVDLRESLQKTGNCAGTDGDVIANLNIPGSQPAGNDAFALLRVRILDPEKIVGEHFTEATVDFADAFDAGGTNRNQTSLVDPLLHGDMCLGLELEVALASVAAIVILQGSFNIDRMGIVSLDEVGVIAVHRPHEGSQGTKKACRKTASESCRFLRQVQGQVQEFGAVARPFADQHGFHECGIFVSVLQFYVRFCVRFHDRYFVTLTL